MIIFLKKLNAKKINNLEANSYDFDIILHLQIKLYEKEIT